MTKLKFILSILSFFHFSSAHAMYCYGEIDNGHIPPRCICKLNNTVPEDSNSSSYFLSSWLPNITFFGAGLICSEILNWGEGPIWKKISPCCPGRCKNFCCKPRNTRNPEISDEEELQERPKRTYGSTDQNKPASPDDI